MHLRWYWTHPYLHINQAKFMWHQNSWIRTLFPQFEKLHLNKNGFLKFKFFEQWETLITFTIPDFPVAASSEQNAHTKKYLMYFSTSLTFALEMLVFKSFGTECKFVTHNDEVLRKHLPMLSNKVEDLSCFLQGTRSIGKLLKKILTREIA